MKATLNLVPYHFTPSPYDEIKAKKRLQTGRDQLLSAAVRYVKDGKEMTRGDRLRLASSLSGIPITLIDTGSRPNAGMK